MKRLIMPMLVSLCVTISACDKLDDGTMPKTTGEEAKAEIKGAVDVVTEKAKQEREEFISKAQKDMDELNVRMKKLTKKLEMATGKAKERLDQQLQKLKQDRDEAEQKIKDVKNETSEKWHELKTGVTNAIDKFRQSIEAVDEDNA